ncbi:MAG TPA: AbiV family abortive infection protein [Sediminibacterium sp.]|nr:AbiV family abortive infection protein [Sediminibacterium sp.]
MRECISASAAIMISADQKWESGRTLAEKGDFGCATSLAIVSLEEQIKALLLLVDGQGFQFRKIKGMHAFFQNHSIRYIIAYYIFVMAVFGEDFFRFIYRLRDNPDHMKEMVSLYQTDKEVMHKKMDRYMMRKIIQLSNEMEWFSRIDIFRQDGFYSDYDVELKTPLIITKEQYIETMERLIRVRFAANEMMRALSNPEKEFSDELEKMQQKLVQDEMYSKIGDGIAMVSRNRKDPFAFMKEWFNDMRNLD